MRNDGKLEPGRKLTGADWFVRVDAGTGSTSDAVIDTAFEDWLDGDAARQDELSRCEAAMQLAARLKDDARVRWAYDDAARLAGTAVADPSRPPVPWFRRAAAAWCVAAACAIAAAAAQLGREKALPDVAFDAPPPGPSVADVPASDPVVVLPGRVTVDSRSVAVLPFRHAGGDPATEDVVARLQDEVVRRLAAIPGTYVIGGEAAAPYAAQKVPLADIAVQLGVRGIVEGRVTTEDGRLRVFMSFTDAANDGRAVHDDFERPLDEMAGLQSDIVTGIALALAESARSAR